MKALKARGVSPGKRGKAVGDAKGEVEREKSDVEEAGSALSRDAATGEAGRGPMESD